MKKTLLALALVGTSTFAMADAWIYGGGNFGEATWSTDDSSETYSDTTMGFHVGTGILPIVGLEVGYQDHGSRDVGLENDYEMSSLYFAAKPSFNFGPVQVYGKVGIHSYDASLEINGIDEADNDGTGIMYGVGAEYFVIDMFSVGAGYQNYVIEDGDIGSFTLNATFHIF